MTGPLGLHEVQAAYLVVMVGTVVSLLGMNYWIETRASTSRITAAVHVHNTAIIWVLAAAVGLVDDDRRIADHNGVAEAFFTERDGNYIGRPLASVAPVLSEALSADGNPESATGTVEFTHRVDGTVRADHGRLLSILENLVRSSVEHAGPDVRITVELTDDGFVVRDDGPGIDANHDRLFDYGYTTSSEGTGLGLRLVQTMAEFHGWDIRVDTDHGGAKFVVTGAVTTVDAPAPPPEP